MSFRSQKLTELCELIVDCPHSTPKWTESGVIVTRNQNIKNGVLDLSSPSYTNEEDYRKRTKRAVPQAGDIIITREAPMGEVCMIPSGLKCCLGQRQVLLRPKQNVNGNYLLWALQSEYVQHQISWNEGTGSTVSNLRIPVLESLEIPRHRNEDYVAEVLSTIASKVELNKATNQTIEKIAQAIFKSWFVDFEPTKAKIAAREALLAENPAATPEQIATAEEQAAIQAIAGAGDVIPTEQLQTIADLFPKQMVNSELGEIPEGWSAQPFGSQADILRGFSYKGKGLVNECSESVPMHNLNSILEGGGYKYSGLKHYSEEFKDKFRVEVGDLFVANTEQGHNHLLIGYGAMVPNHLAHGFFSHHLYRIRPNKAAVLSPEYISYLFKKGRFVRQVQGFTNGTTVNMLPIDGLKLPLCIVPNKQLVHCFSESVKPMHELIEKNTINNERLESMRDLLLPKLLSGELTNG